MAASPPRRILVTGSTGFVGRHLVPLIKTSFPEADVMAHHVEITDRSAVLDLIRDARPDACIHLAALTTIAGANKDPDRAWRVNLHGTLNLARSILQHAPDCTLLFASSSEIYGRSFASGRPLDEAALLAPMNSYAASKAAADLALGAMVGEGLRVVRLRLFNHTGPGQSEQFVLPAFARQIALIESGRQAPAMRVGGLDSMRDFLDVRDVCQAYVTCLHRLPDLIPETILNIASGAPRRIGEILRELLDLAGLDVELSTDQGLLRGSEISSASGDNSRARQVLGWTPLIPWRQTLLDVMADWRARTTA